MQKKYSLALLAAGLALGANSAHAGPHGYDLHNTLAPASAGLAGTSIATPQDNVSALFGNPATLAKFPGTEFTLGVSFYQPEARLRHDGSVTGEAFSARSDQGIYPIPQIAVTHDFEDRGLPVTAGLGLTATSGIGADFKGEPASGGTSAQFLVLGVNAGLGYRVTENFNLGAAATVSYAQLDLGLQNTVPPGEDFAFGSAGNTNDIGFRATLGATYDFGDTTVGGFYQTKQRHRFSNLVVDGTGEFQKVTIEQPANVGVGISNNSLMDGDLLLMADVLYKDWSSTRFWGDVYDDQWAFSVGAQLTRNNIKYRLGYGYAEDPTRSTVSGLGNLAIPVNGIEYLQAAQAQVIYKHRLTAGLGVEDFLTPGLNLDLSAGWQFKEDRDYGTGTLSGGGHTNAEVYSWHVGFGLTWQF